MTTNRDQGSEPPQPRTVTKIGRNDPCPAAAREYRSAAASRRVKRVLYDIKEITDQIQQLKAKIDELRIIFEVGQKRSRWRNSTASWLSRVLGPAEQPKYVQAVKRLKESWKIGARSRRSLMMCSSFWNWLLKNRIRSLQTNCLPVSSLCGRG